MRINKQEKKIYIFEALVFLVVLVFGLILLSAPVLVRVYGSIISLGLIIALAVALMGFPKDHHYLRGSAIRTIITILLATGIVIYTAGIFLGFNRGLGINGLKSLFSGLVPVILMAAAIEVLRFILFDKVGKHRKSVVVFTTLSIILQVLLALNISTLIDVESVFIFLCVSVFPIIADELLCTYLTINIGLSPSLVYKIAVKSYLYILPIVPNLGNYIFAVVSILTPYLIYRMVDKSDTFDSRAKKRLRKARIGILTAPIVLAVAIITLLVSGIFKYQLIAIGSDSMHGTYDRGDAVLIEKLSATDIEENDILAFRKNGIIITHRVVDIIKENGQITFITKGDAREEVDGFTTPGENVIGRVISKAKYIGFPTLWMNEIFNKEVQ